MSEIIHQRPIHDTITVNIAILSADDLCDVLNDCREKGYQFLTEATIKDGRVLVYTRDANAHSYQIAADLKGYYPSISKATFDDPTKPWQVCVVPPASMTVAEARQLLEWLTSQPEEHGTMGYVGGITPVTLSKVYFDNEDQALAYLGKLREIACAGAFAMSPYGIYRMGHYQVWFHHSVMDKLPEDVRLDLLVHYPAMSLCPDGEQLWNCCEFTTDRIDQARYLVETLVTFDRRAV